MSGISNLQFAFCNSCFLLRLVPFSRSEKRQLFLVLRQRMPECLAARKSQRAECPRLGQPGKHRTAQAGAAGEIVQRAEGPIAPGLLDPLGMGRRQAMEHAKAQPQGEGGSGQWAGGSG